MAPPGVPVKPTVSAPLYARACAASTALSPCTQLTSQQNLSRLVFKALWQGQPRSQTSSAYDPKQQKPMAAGHRDTPNVSPAAPGKADAPSLPYSVRCPGLLADGRARPQPSDLCANSGSKPAKPCIPTRGAHRRLPGQLRGERHVVVQRGADVEVLAAVPEHAAAGVQHAALRRPAARTAAARLPHKMWLVTGCHVCNGDQG